MPKGNCSYGCTLWVERCFILFGSTELEQCWSLSPLFEQCMRQLNTPMMSTLHTRIFKGSGVLHYQSVHFSGHVETWVSNHFCWSPKILFDVDIFAATSWPTLQCGFPESIRVDSRPRERYGESAGCPAFGRESGAWGKGPGRWVGTSEELYADGTLVT